MLFDVGKEEAALRLAVIYRDGEMVEKEVIETAKLFEALMSSTTFEYCWYRIEMGFNQQAKASL